MTLQDLAELLGQAADALEPYVDVDANAAGTAIRCAEAFQLCSRIIGGSHMGCAATEVVVTEEE